MSEEPTEPDFLSRENLTDLIKDGIIFSLVGLGVNKAKDTLENFIEEEEEEID